MCLYRPDSCASGAWSRIATCLAAGSLCRNWTLTLSSVRNFPLTSWRRNVKASRNHTCVLGTFTKSSARFPPSRLMLIASLGHRSSSARALHNTWSLWPAKIEDGTFVHILATADGWEMHTEVFAWGSISHVEWSISFALCLSYARSTSKRFGWFAVIPWEGWRALFFLVQRMIRIGTALKSGNLLVYGASNAGKTSLTRPCCLSSSTRLLCVLIGTTLSRCKGWRTIWWLVGRIRGTPCPR